MSTFTNLGVGSGLDLNSLVTNLVALERKPLEQLQRQAQTLQTQVSLFGQMSSLMSSFQTASDALNNPLLWSGTTLASTDSSAVAASSSGTVQAGTYSVAVSQLASAQTTVSKTAFSSPSATIGGGQLTIELGRWNSDQSAFTPKSGASAITLSVGAGDSLSSVVSKINSAGAGVSASVVTDASGSRIALRSSTTGETNGFRIQVADNDGNNTDDEGLSIMAFDPPAGATGMQLMQGGANAKATVNGIAISSETNTVTGAVEGLTLNLAKVSATPVTITATSDTAAVQTAVKAFATAYSNLASFLNTQTKYDGASQRGGPLQGDRAAVALQDRLRSMIGATSGASSSFARLSNVGLELQRDGTLSVNQSKLDAAIGNLGELKKAFSASDLSGANAGFSRRASSLMTEALGVDGVVTGRKNGLQTLINKNGDDQSKVNDRADMVEKRLVAQYTQLDSTVSRLNALSSYVNQQIANWNKSSGS